MNERKTKDEILKRIAKVIDDASSVMLVTHAPDDTLHGRPMAPTTGGKPGEVWFATSASSPKVEEIERDRRALASYQSGGQHVVLTGKARVVDDGQRARDLWEESWRLWFPNGPDDPEIRLICFEAEHAELWDASGTRGMRLGWEAVKAWLKNRRIDADVAREHHQIDV